MDDQNSSTISAAPAPVVAGMPGSGAVPTNAVPSGLTTPVTTPAPVYTQPAGDQQVPVADQSVQQTQTSQPVQPAQAAPVSTPSDDPLARLMGLVQGGDGASSLAGLNVKELFVVTKSKLSNKSLRKIVEIYKQKGDTDDIILETILSLDESVENGEISEELFQQLEQDGDW